MGQGNRSKATRQAEPGFTGRFIVDTWRGQPRIRAWPRSRGKVKSKDQKVQTDWFRHVQQQYNKIPPIQILSFMRTTAGTGLYPRDMFMKAKAGTMLPIHMSDGRVLTGRQLRVDPVTWQGFVLGRTTDITVGSGYNLVTFPTPYLQTAPFWDAGSPDRITIPEGVTKMEFSAGMMWSTTGSVQARGDIHFIDSDLPYNYVNIPAVGRPGHTISTGPLVVAEGEQYGFKLNLSAGGTLLGYASFFSGTILEGS